MKIEPLAEVELRTNAIEDLPGLTILQRINRSVRETPAQFCEIRNARAMNLPDTPGRDITND